MKKIYLSFMLSLGALVGFGQATGDIAFVSFNVDTDEDFAIVALADIPANTVIYFTDNEPNGSAISTGEGTFSWNTGASAISAGTVITFNDVASSTALTSSVGTLTDGTGTFALSQNGDGIVAYLGTEGNPTTFLAGIQNEDGNEGSLTGSGLTLGSTFITISPDASSSPDGGNYTGSRNSQATFSGYINLISDFANWTTVESNGEDAFPFNTTSFTESAAMSVGFDEPTSQVNETNATFQTSIPITLANYNGNQVDLSVAVTGGSATTADYVLNTTSLSFTADGSMNVSLDIIPDADDVTETIEITISETTSTGISISPNLHTITINDDDTAPLIITEIMYNPATELGSDTNFEYIEIYNAGSSTVNLDGYTLSSAFDGSFTTGDQITAGEYILVAIDATSYTTTGGQVFEWSSGSLQNGGESIVLKNASGATVDEVTYNPSIIEAADGNGPSLSLFDLTADNSDMTYWIGSGTTNGTPGAANSDITLWTSTSSTDFSNSGNWSNGVPSSTVSAVVSAGGSDPAVTSDVVAASLKIGIGATLNITSSSLSVSGELVLDGTANVSSGASLALLGQASGAGDLSVSRNSTGNAGYSILGAPVDGALLADIAADFLYDYDEATSTFAVPSISSMPEGRGFFVGYNDQTPTVSVTWSGSPVAGDITRNITANGAGFNLVANPYAAAISTSAFLNAASTTTHTDGTIYLWDDGGTNETGGVRGGDYITINDMGTLATGTIDLAGTGQTGAGPASNGFITSTQGFFVKAMTGTTDPNVTFTQDMQVTTADANSDANHYRIGVDKQLVRLSVSGNSLYNEILIGFVEGATLGADRGLDATKFSGNSLISFYSLQEDEKYAIQTLPSLASEATAVQLGMDLAEAGQYTLKLNGIEGISSNMKLEIIDHATGITYDLRETSEVSFATENALIASKRFELILTPAEALKTKSLSDQNEALVFGFQGRVNVLVNDEIAKANIRIYTLGGSQIARFSDVNLSSKKWSADFSKQGLFIMTIESQNLMISKKFVNQ